MRTPTESAEPAEPPAPPDRDSLPNRIAFVITRGDTPGGAQTHVRDLAERLVADGATVRVFTGSTGIFTDELEARNIGFEIVPHLRREMAPAADLRAVRRLAARLRRFRPDLVSTHTAKAGLVGRLAARLSGAPAVFTAHGWQFAPGIPALQRAPVYAMELVLSRLSAAVITVSRFDQRLARRSAAVPSRRLHLVRNGLPDSPTATTRAGGADPVCFTMVARFQEQKDHATLIRAAHALRTYSQPPTKDARTGASGPGRAAPRWSDALGSGDPGWRLRFVGDGPLLGACRALAEELGIDDQVQFLGERGNVAEILAASDVYVLASHWEGLPRSIIEAMRAGLPVVATDVGGVRELVEHGVNGYLVPPREPGRFATRLLELINNPDQRARLGQAGRARYERELTFDAMYARTRRVYASAVRSQSGGKKRYSNP